MNQQAAGPQVPLKGPCPAPSLPQAVCYEALHYEEEVSLVVFSRVPTGHIPVTVSPLF